MSTPHLGKLTPRDEPGSPTIDDPEPPRVIRRGWKAALRRVAAWAIAWVVLILAAPALFVFSLIIAIWPPQRPLAKGGLPWKSKPE